MNPRVNKVHPLDNYKLRIEFINGEVKIFDLSPYLGKEAFLPLKEPGNFGKVVNKSYFVEWMGLDIDLSADTLWHLGV